MSPRVLLGVETRTRWPALDDQVDGVLSSYIGIILPASSGALAAFLLVERTI